MKAMGVEANQKHAEDYQTGSSKSDTNSTTSPKKAMGVGAAAGFVGSAISLVVMFLFPNNPFAIWADTLLGIPGQVGVTVQPLGWVFHSTLITIWAAIFGLVAWKTGLRRIYLGAVGWGLLAWLWTLAIIQLYGLLSAAVAFIELAAYLVYSLVVAAGFSYGVWGTVEATVTEHQP
jgi:hypothetical protein